jgi:hypothetical protein
MILDQSNASPSGVSERKPYPQEPIQLKQITKKQQPEYLHGIAWEHLPSEGSPQTQNFPEQHKLAEKEKP